MNIGILAIQGSVIEHKRNLEKLGVQVVEVRLPDGMKNLDGIILPGGESTAQSKLLRRFKLFNKLKKQIKEGMPVWGTCTGAILLAKKVVGKNPPPTLEVMDIVADRNAYGRQIDSFAANLKIEIRTSKIESFQGIFIRAPKLDKLSDNACTERSRGVEVLSKYKSEIVMMRQKNMLVTSFHPELTDDTRVHEYFVGMCENLL